MNDSQWSMRILIYEMLSACIQFDNNGKVGGVVLWTQQSIREGKWERKGKKKNTFSLREVTVKRKIQSIVRIPVSIKCPYANMSSQLLPNLCVAYTFEYFTLKPSMSMTNALLSCILSQRLQEAVD